MHISPAHTQSAGSGRALPEGTREKKGADKMPLLLFYMIAYTICDPLLVGFVICICVPVLDTTPPSEAKP